ncbi:lysozyme family protein [Enterococcus sp. CWB-B31]|uniref:lysozyme family protein n=1 Tax=Enterococcus sp. CWB-B31 TaxID=2885159 RepID=UPI001E37E18A|nr:lysozyme family protein [Enterococcus sp. CWB-B31]MCB5955974.1 lysozyme family protein [Enterococcus sp. CWB-B31]
MKIIKKLGVFFLLLITITVILLGYKIRENVQQVAQYEEQVELAAEQMGIPEYKQLILAIIYTESKGRSVDLMQSSESVYGQQSVIDNPEESIEYGVKFLAEAIQQNREAGNDLWTAVQAYNYGLEYIRFVKERGGKNTMALSEEYSREFLSPLLGNENEETYRYYRLQSIIHNGGFLYRNGGNMFYADIVKMNQNFIHWFS